MLKDKGNDIFLMIQSLKGARRKAFLKEIADESASFPRELVRVDFRPVGDLIEVWRSSQYLVQVHAHTDKIDRLSINRTEINESYSRWKDGLTWDTLQRLKRECGRGDFVSCEIFPADNDVVNVANIRHLWVFKGGGNELINLGIVWGKNPRQESCPGTNREVTK